MTRTLLAAILAIAAPAGAAVVPVLHSLPGAAFTAVLDFDDYSNGSTTVAAWGTEAQRREVWQIVSDAANRPTDRSLDGTITHPLGFDLDVTTVDPGRRDGTVAICHVGDIAGLTLGGYAYVRGVTYGQPDCFVATNNLAESARYAGIAAAHEAIGHDLIGLLHQVDVDANGNASDAYQLGDAIMGEAYFSAMPLWQQGWTDYGGGAGATVRPQDDYAQGVAVLGVVPEPVSLAIVGVFLIRQRAGR